jgi:glycosyltransferase involved in cell wall biosynthesis
LKRIIFFTSSHKIGLTGQLTEQALSFTKNYRSEFLFVSGEKEQFSGLFKKLDNNNVNYAKIQGIDDHSEFHRLVKEFNYFADQVRPQFVTVQTNWQLAIVVAAKYIYWKKYRIIYAINGYRHNYKFRSFIAKYVIGLALFIFADYVITPSSFLKRQFGFLRRKNIIIFIGEDKDFFREYSPPSFTETKRFVFPGEFRAGKGQELLIRVIKRYIDVSGNDDVELYLPGKGKNLETCKNLSKKLGLEKKVIFPGFLNRDQMRQLYLKCQFALVPSNVETFGHCIVEPFILGRVVISRHVGVADDIIIPGKTGFFFDDEEDLLEVLLAVVSNEALCATVAKNAFDQRDKFRWEPICKLHFDLIYDILETH